MIAALQWDLAPVMFELGPFDFLGLTFNPKVRYYGLMFMLTILGAYFFWRRQMRRGGFDERITQGFFIWGVLATVVGARLGHCFFYNAEYYLTHLREIPAFWHGGLSSHGATAGLIAALVLYAVYNRQPILEILDRFAMSAAVGAAGIRLGNFLNSEIVGRVTNVPWAVEFLRYESPAQPRHPSQLYEFALGLSVLGLLILADRLAGREKRPRGLLAGLFLAMYFFGRFYVELFKEYHVEGLRGGLTMGQYLSIVPFTVGVALLVWVKRHPTPAGPAKVISPTRPRV